ILLWPPLHENVGGRPKRRLQMPQDATEFREDRRQSLENPHPDHLPDLRQHGLVLSPPVEARPVLRLPVRRRPAHAQCTADGREWVSRHGLNTPYQLGLFFTSACAAWRISTSMVFRPSARSSS